MKENELFKNIFSLAVNLAGLWFIYLGLRDMPPILQLPTTTGYTTTDVVTAILPVAFNLLAGWWLIGNKFLIRCGYSENKKNLVSNHSISPAESANAATKPAPTSTETESKSVDEKLATLLKNPK